MTSEEVSCGPTGARSRRTLARRMGQYLVSGALLSSVIAQQPLLAFDRCARAESDLLMSRPLAEPMRVIAHRGASGLRPEHTLGAYRLAIVAGASFIEPDLVPTSDGVLVARHEPMLAEVRLTETGEIARQDGGPIIEQASTDVAHRPEFRDRLTVKELDGALVGGWFVEDFSAAEVATLWAREPLPQTRPANVRFDDRYRIPTLEQIIDLVRQPGPDGRRVGIYPELKHPTHFLRTGRRRSGEPIAIDVAQLVIDRLVAAEFADPNRVVVQSFEPTVLIRLAREIMPAADVSLPRVQLLGRPGRLPADLATPEGRLLAPELADGDLTDADALAVVASYASGIGPSLRGLDQALVRRAHCHGLEVHTYTLRAEPEFAQPSPGDRRMSFSQRLLQLHRLGVDGVFTDQPGLARNFLSRLRRR